MPAIVRDNSLLSLPIILAYLPVSVISRGSQIGTRSTSSIVIS
jgi:hypothetical protein